MIADSAAPVRHGRTRSVPTTICCVKAIGAWRAAAEGRGAWIALILAGVLALPLATARLYASDEIQYFAYLRSLWFDRDLSFDNEYRYFYDRGIAVAWTFRESYLERTTATGLRYNYGTIGAAILWAPFYAAADGAVRVGRALGVPVAADGFSRPYLRAVAYGSAVYGFLAICLAILAARRLLGEGHLAGAAVWMGTPLLHYMYVAPGFAHACSAFAVALFVSVWLAVRERWSAGGLVALGASSALMTMVREPAAFLVIGPAIDFVWSLVEAARQNRWERVRLLLLRVAAGTAVAFVCYLPQVMAYVTLYGGLTSPYNLDDRMLWHAPHFGDVLASPRHGFFFWTPLAAVALAGLGWFAATGAGRIGTARGRRIGICLLAMFASQAYIAGSITRWTLAGSFGQRRFVGTTVILAIGLAAAIRWVRGATSGRPYRRAAAVAVLAACVWWNVALMAQYGASIMNRRQLEPARNAYVSFVVLPRRLPALAQRYLFDRSSFYLDPERYGESPAPAP